MLKKNKIEISRSQFLEYVEDPLKRSAVNLSFRLLALEAEWSFAEMFGYAWEQVRKLHDDYDDDVWYDLEYWLRRLELIEDYTDLYIRYPATWEEPEDYDFNEKLFEKKYRAYKTLLLKQVYQIEEEVKL